MKIIYNRDKLQKKWNKTEYRDKKKNQEPQSCSAKSLIEQLINVSSLSFIAGLFQIFLITGIMYW